MRVCRSRVARHVRCLQSLYVTCVSTACVLGIKEEGYILHTGDRETVNKVKCYVTVFVLVLIYEAFKDFATRQSETFNDVNEYKWPHWSNLLNFYSKRTNLSVRNIGTYLFETVGFTKTCNWNWIHVSLVLLQTFTDRGHVSFRSAWCAGQWCA